MFSKFYTPRNYAAVAVHYGLTGGLLVGAFLLGGPVVLAAGAALGAIGAGVTVVLNKKIMEDGLELQPVNHEDSPRLGETAKELYKAAGISSETYPIYDFRTKAKSTGSALGGLGKMAQTYNAAALNFGKPVIIISDPLLKLLDDEEEKAVLAHEFTHAGAHHNFVSLPQQIAAGMTRFAGTVVILSNIITAGVAAVGTLIGGHMLKNAAKNSMLHKEKKHPVLSALNKPLTFRQTVANKIITGRANLAGQVAVTAALSYMVPGYLPLYAAAKGLGLGAGVLTKTFSRSNEYQADRGAVLLGASPLALITSLRKITQISKESTEKAYEGPLPRPFKLVSLWKELNATHPKLERRINRLAAIAREKGYTEEQIETAKTGKIDTSHAEHLSPDVIKTMMRFL